jgi:hypothetical protein
MADKRLREKVVHLPLNNQRHIQTAVSPAQRIEYVADMLLQLKDIAAASKLHVLSGILDVAYQEARRS